jgi:hypothetical protein
MKIRTGTFPRQVDLFNSEGEKVSSIPEEGTLIIVEMTKGEVKRIFGEPIKKSVAEIPAPEILRKLAEAWKED